MEFRTVAETVHGPFDARAVVFRAAVAVAVGNDPRQRAAIADFEQNGLSVGNMYAVGTRICTWYAAWLAGAQARLGDGEGAYRNLKRAAASAGAFAEIFEINEPTYRSCPWCSSPQGTFVQAVNEMLLQGEGDDLRLAPAVPASWRDFACARRAARLSRRCSATARA